MITKETYIELSKKLGEFYALGPEAVSYSSAIPVILQDTALTSKQIANAAVLGNSAVITSDLLEQNHVSISKNLKALVVALQQHVIKNYKTVDEFLEDQGILVPSSFATLSFECGFPISPSNIMAQNGVS